jgi:DNA repair protein RAD50
VQIEGVRRDIAAIDKEINESGATMSNLRDNIIVRKLKEKVEAIDKEIASYDMEEAAKARRNYEDKYQPAKAKEQKCNEVVRTFILSRIFLSFFTLCSIINEQESWVH